MKGLSIHRSAFNWRCSTRSFCLPRSFSAPSNLISSPSASLLCPARLCTRSRKTLVPLSTSSRLNSCSNSCSNNRLHSWQRSFSSEAYSPLITTTNLDALLNTLLNSLAAPLSTDDAHMMEHFDDEFGSYYTLMNDSLLNQHSAHILHSTTTSSSTSACTTTACSTLNFSPAAVITQPDPTHYVRSRLTEVVHDHVADECVVNLNSNAVATHSSSPPPVSTSHSNSSLSTLPPSPSSSSSSSSTSTPFDQPLQHKGRNDGFIETWEQGSIEPPHSHAYGDSISVLEGLVSLQFYIRRVKDGTLMKHGSPVMLSAGDSYFIEPARIHEVKYLATTQLRTTNERLSGCATGSKEDSATGDGLQGDIGVTLQELEGGEAESQVNRASNSTTPTAPANTGPATKSE